MSFLSHETFKMFGGVWLGNSSSLRIYHVENSASSSLKYSKVKRLLLEHLGKPSIGIIKQPIIGTAAPENHGFNGFSRLTSKRIQLFKPSWIISNIHGDLVLNWFSSLQFSLEKLKLLKHILYFTNMMWSYRSCDVLVTSTFTLGLLLCSIFRCY